MVQALASAVVPAAVASTAPSSSATAVTPVAAAVPVAPPPAAVAAAGHAEGLLVQLLLRLPVGPVRVAFAPLQRLARYRVEERLGLVVALLRGSRGCCRTLEDLHSTSNNMPWKLYKFSREE